MLNMTYGSDMKMTRFIDEFVVMWNRDRECDGKER